MNRESCIDIYLKESLKAIISDSVDEEIKKVDEEIEVIEQ